MAEPNKPAENRETTPAPAPKKRWRLSNLFFNNRFVLVFSLVCAVLLWLVFALSDAEERGRVLYNVPVEVVVDADASDLQVFSQSVSTVNVSVEGNSLILNRIAADDVRVTAVLNHSSNVTPDPEGGMATYQLTIVAQKNGNELADFEVVGCSAETMTVKADSVAEVMLPLTNRGTYTVSEDRYMNAPTFSADSVTVAGPRSVVGRVRTVGVEYEIDQPLDAPQRVTGALRCLDEDGNEVDDEYLTLSLDSVDVSFNVLARKTLTLSPSFVHMPGAFPQNRITVTPATVEVAAAEDALQNLTELTLDTVIDFAKFTPQSTSATVELTLPTGFRNLSEVTRVEVRVDLTGYVEGHFAVSDINVHNASSNQYVSQVTKSVEVTVLGPSADIARLRSADLYCVVDLTNTNNQYGAIELPVTLSVLGSDTCWVVGDYSVNLEISDTPPPSPDPQASSAAPESDVVAE